MSIFIYFVSLFFIVHSYAVVAESQDSSFCKVSESQEGQEFVLPLVYEDLGAYKFYTESESLFSSNVASVVIPKDNRAAIYRLVMSPTYQRGFVMFTQYAKKLNVNFSNRETHQSFHLGCKDSVPESRLQNLLQPQEDVACKVVKGFRPEGGTYREETFELMKSFNPFTKEFLFSAAESEELDEKKFITTFNEETKKITVQFIEAKQQSHKIAEVEIFGFTPFQAAYVDGENGVYKLVCHNKAYFKRPSYERIFR